VTVYSDWAAVQAALGNVVVSKMAALAKQRADGTTKLRGRWATPRQSDPLDDCCVRHPSFVLGSFTFGLRFDGIRA
jgi:hypothetical protein